MAILWRVKRRLGRTGKIFTGVIHSLRIATICQRAQSVNTVTVQLCEVVEWERDSEARELIATE